ncbi:SPOR domain-containing protein [Piscinibacter sp.]|jgi:DedD protein|uniref:SPOR domain-containing protein n=1 Tax=Piscinibacter sp. TaxID=1903157 RepID=UPI002F407E0D
MGLLSIFQSKSRAAAAKPARAEPPADAVAQARTRARRRLIGAVVLVGIGVVGFPLLFETQPRPIPVDIPIEIPRKEGAPPLVMPAARPKTPVALAPAEPAASSAPTAIITETRADAGREVPAAPTPAGSAAPKAPEPAPAKKAAEPAPAPKAAEPAAAAKPAAKDGARYVVQVGAFADASAARETRLKVEKLGMKTYTQVAETPAGNRIRVRVGPFASREDADRALAKAKAAGVAAVVLTL